jgi:hypothetical protein
VKSPVLPYFPDNTQLEWTGPGALYVEPLLLERMLNSYSSDAVFRYFLVKYGIHPSELSGKSVPVKYGDVV